VFMYGGDIAATVCDADDALRRLRGRAQAPWRVPDRMQVRFMNQATTITRMIKPSALIKGIVRREVLL
jgi:hypothetical protein